MELKDYLRIIERRWLAVIAIFLLVLGTYLLMAHTMQTPRYASSAEIVIKQSPYELGVLLSDEFATLITPFPARVSQIRGIEVSRRASKILEEKGISIGPEHLQSAISTRPDAEQRTVVISIEYGGDPTLVVKIVDAVVQAYAEFDLARAAASKEKVKGALEHRQKQVEGIEKAAREARLSFVRSSLDARSHWDPEEQARLKLDQLSQLDRYRLQLELNAATLEEARKAGVAPGEIPELGPLQADGSFLTGETPSASAAPYPSITESQPITGYARQEYDRIAAELASARLRYTDDHPKVKDLLAQQTLWKGLIEAPAPIKGPPQAPIDLQIRLNQERKRVVDSLIDRIWNSLRGFVENKEEFDAREAELASAREELRDIRRKLNELILRISGEQSAVEKTSGPDLAHEVASRGVLTLPFAVLVAIVLAVSGGYTLEYLSDTLRSAQDSKVYLNVPAIATIPFFRGEPINLFEVALKSPVAELFNKLATFLESVAVEQHAKTFLFTSSKPEEGKSTISLNAAIAIARGGERVVLVDSDLRKPQYHMFFNLDNAGGLSTLLSGEAPFDETGENLAPFLKPTSIETLRVLPAGPTPANPVGQLKSDRLPLLIEALKHYADIVIFDSPPLIGVIDAAVISALVDVTVVVIAEGQVTRREAAQVKHTLAQVDANVVGTVINKAHMQPEEYYYYYQYYRTRR
ncbi:MAG: polysaccharide biosynthesis tyrosine autokinase [Planctomycetes bacterium]|nr:polysaccharide biosynthesis tyrosine autokinase [Planctomycetota bacterium]